MPVQRSTRKSIKSLLKHRHVLLIFHKILLKYHLDTQTNKEFIENIGTCTIFRSYSCAIKRANFRYSFNIWNLSIYLFRIIVGYMMVFFQIINISMIFFVNLNKFSIISINPFSIDSFSKKCNFMVQKSIPCERSKKL